MLQSIIVLKITAALFISFIGDAARAAETRQLDLGKAVCENNCQVCHSLEYVTSTKKSRASWEKTLAAMQKNGMWELSPKDRSQLLDYLTNTFGSDGSAPGQATYSLIRPQLNPLVLKKVDKQ